MLGSSIRLALISIISIVLGGAIVFGFMHKNQEELNELRYLDRAIDLKWNITILKAIKDNKVDNAIKYHEKLIETTLVELSSYGADSTMEYESQIVPIIDMAKSYK